MPENELNELSKEPLLSLKVQNTLLKMDHKLILYFNHSLIILKHLKELQGQKLWY